MTPFHAITRDFELFSCTRLMLLLFVKKSFQKRKKIPDTLMKYVVIALFCVPSLPFLCDLLQEDNVKAPLFFHFQQFLQTGWSLGNVG